MHYLTTELKDTPGFDVNVFRSILLMTLIVLFKRLITMTYNNWIIYTENTFIKPCSYDILSQKKIISIFAKILINR